MNNLWIPTKLADVCGFQNGFAFKSSTFKQTGVPIIRISNIQDDTIDVYNRLVFFDPKDYDENLDRYRVVEGDLVIAMSGATTGKIGFNTENIVFYLNQRVGKFEPGKNLVKRFLYYYLSMNVEENLRISAGAAQPNLSTEQIKSFVIPIPPLPEQHRIVAILDEAFEAIAIAKANAEKNLQNARAVFESYLESVFTERGPGWVATTLSRATDGIFTGPFGSLLHKSDYVANGIPLVNPAHITKVGIEPDLRKTVSKETAINLKNYIMRAGDVVIGRRGEMGRCALVTENEDGWLCGTSSFFIKPSSRCDSRYLVRLLRSESCKARLEKIAGGAVMPNLSNTDLGNLAVDLPPLKIQISIVEEIDDLHAQTQTLTQIYQCKLFALDELKKSLLHQAFSGAL